MSEFEVLWEGFNEKLLNYIKSHVNNTHDAEDILQNVFMKIFINVGNLENKEATKSWIYRITKNTIIDFYKKKKDVSVSPETFHWIEEETEHVDNLNEELSQCMINMLFTLPEKYKDVYEMYEKKEMKHKDIAETLDITVSASKVRLKRAKEMFKDKLMECCDFEVDKYGNVIEYKSKKECYTLFNLLSNRNDKGSIIITSNLTFERWNEIFNDTVLTGALVDRLAHKAHILEIPFQLCFLYFNKPSTRHIVALKI